MVTTRTAPDQKELSVEVCSVVYAPWFAAAAACRVRAFEASVSSLRFDVVSRVAVVASGEHAVRSVMSCVCLVGSVFSGRHDGGGCRVALRNWRVSGAS